MLKKLILWSLGIVAMLAVVLVAHIVAMANKPPKHLANTQLARIDFEAPLDAEAADQVRSAVQAMPGVGHCFVNAEAGTLVYSYERGQQSPETVFTRVGTISDTGCERFTVAEADLSGSCPAMANSGLMTAATNWIRNLSN